MNPSAATWDPDAKHVEVLRCFGVAGRLKQAFGMYDFARQVMLTRVRSRHPEWPADQVKTEVRCCMENAGNDRDLLKQWNKVQMV